MTYHSIYFLLSYSEKANLAVTLVNANNEVIAFAAFFDYPNIPTIDQALWEEWLSSKYECTKATVSRMMDIHDLIYMRRDLGKEGNGRQLVGQRGSHLKK
jgi:hypothetical protein